MSIVKEIVDLHCGKVSIESSLGKGTKVTIWLPIADQSISQVEHPAVEMPFLGGHI
jgi:signal transduction histidine kinase